MVSIENRCGYMLRCRLFVLVLKDTSIPMAWNLSINFRRRDSEKPKEVSCVTEELQKWSEEFKVEETRAIHSLGKYRLAPVYDQFQIDPTRWNYWSPERQVQHVNSFREFLPKSYDSYTKPTSAGHKTSKSTKRRADLPEPEIFADRIPNVNPPLKKTALTPLRLSTVGESSQWQVRLIHTDYLHKSTFH